MEHEPHRGAGPETTGEQETDQRERVREDRPKIYAASLSDYNAGILHGAWIDAAQAPEALHDEVSRMLSLSPNGYAEEFAIHDYEHFGHYKVDEYDSLERVARVARGICEHGLAYAAWETLREGEADETGAFEDAFRGDWASVEEYAEDLLDDFGCLRELEEAMPEVLQGYVDVDIAGFARDLELGGDITTVEHQRGVWIFDGHR